MAWSLMGWRDVCLVAAVAVLDIGVGVYLVCRGLVDLARARRERARARGGRPTRGPDGRGGVGEMIGGTDTDGRER
jgi:hypothetical protein